MGREERRTNLRLMCAAADLFVAVLLTGGLAFLHELGEKTLV